MNKNHDCEKSEICIEYLPSRQYRVRKLRIENFLGLHARPATALANLLRNTKSNVTFTFGQRTADAKSALGLLMLAAPKDALITVSVDGPDAIDAIDLIESAFRCQFGEQQL